MFNIFNRREGSSIEGGQDDGYRWRGGAYLTTVTESFQADLLESKLRGENIPCQRKYVGSSSYLEIVFGNSTVGAIELYVPEDCLEDARNIIQPIDLDDCIPEGEDGAE